MIIHLALLVQCLAILTIANGAPVIMKKLIGKTWAWPIDAGRLLPDGRPLFGPSKTFRGLIAAVVLSTLAAPAIGLDMMSGALLGSGAMIGDLVSSFSKRRMGLSTSSSAPGLDQIPESLLPMIMVSGRLGLSGPDLVVGVVAFWIGEIVVSRILFALGVRDRPY